MSSQFENQNLCVATRSVLHTLTHSLAHYTTRHDTNTRHCVNQTKEKQVPICKLLAECCGVCGGHTKIEMEENALPLNLAQLDEEDNNDR